MSKEAELEARFWKQLKSDMIVMLGLSHAEGGHYQPMAAQIDSAERGPIWFFTAKDTDLVRLMGQGAPAAIQFADKGHDLFASIEGRLVPDNDRATIDRLWNPWAAAWYEGGKDDPKLQLVRFDPDKGEIWLNENNLFAGIKTLLGIDPKKDYKDKVATVDLA